MKVFGKQKLSTGAGEVSFLSGEVLDQRSRLCDPLVGGGHIQVLEHPIYWLDLTPAN